MFKWLIRKIQAWCDRTGRFILIPQKDSDKPYLMRWMPFKSKFCTVYIHRFLSSDEGVPHDHPWYMLAYMIEGEYTEHRWIPDFKDKGLLKKSSGHRTANSIAFRKNTDMHMVEIDKDRSVEEQEQAPWTICFVFGRNRVWGFVDPNEKGYNWTNWQDYLGIYKGDSRYDGSE